MASPQIIIDDHGLLSRMSKFPQKLKSVLNLGLDATLVILHEKVPPYPPPPPSSSYRRTGTLGRTLGSSISGGKSGGLPSIYEKKLGASGGTARFGTNLEYAQYVIGEDTQAGHMGHWWRVSKIAKDAQGKIIKLWEGLMGKMSSFLEGKNA